jgi:hypothetical protein
MGKTPVNKTLDVALLGVAVYTIPLTVKVIVGNTPSTADHPDSGLSLR